MTDACPGERAPFSAHFSCLAQRKICYLRDPLHMFRKSAMNVRLTGSVSARFFRRIVPRPDLVARDARDGAQVHDGGAMDLLEDRGVEHVQQLADRLADQRLALGGGDHRVLVLGLEVGDILDEDQARLLADVRGDPRERRRGARAPEASRAAHRGSWPAPAARRRPRRGAISAAARWRRGDRERAASTGSRPRPDRRRRSRTGCTP